VRSDTPNPFKLCDPRFLYAVKNQQSHFPPAYNVNVQIAYRDIQQVLSLKEVEGRLDVDLISRDFCNAGVVLINREFHTELYKIAYNLFLGTNTQWWDQIPLNMAIYSQLGGYHDLGQEWNYQFPSNFAAMTAYIYHFAGNPGRYDILKRVNWVIAPSEIITRNDLHRLISQRGYKVGAEIGTQKGEYAEYLLHNTWLEKLHIIDAWKYVPNYKDISNVSDEAHNANYTETLERLAPFVGRYNVIKAFSKDAANIIGDLDFVYIDANHSYTSTTEDLQTWYPKVRSGGLVAGHDFLDGENICGSEFGVRSAVFDFLKDKKHTLYATNEQWPTWIFFKE